MHNRYICTLSRTYLHAFSLFKTSTRLRSPRQAGRGEKKMTHSTSAATSCKERNTRQSLLRASANERAPRTSVRNFVCGRRRVCVDNAARHPRRCRLQFFLLALLQVRLVFREPLGIRKNALERMGIRKNALERKYFDAEPSAAHPPMTNHYSYRCPSGLVQRCKNAVKTAGNVTLTHW